MVTDAVRLQEDFEGYAELTLPEPNSRGNSRLELTAGEIGPQEREFFTASHCHWLTCAISSMTGWGIVGLKGTKNGADWAWHSAVVTPDGAVLDITGRYDSVEEFAEKWRAESGQPLTSHRIGRPEHMFDNYMVDPVMPVDRYWWTRSYPATTPIFQHYARLVIRRHGYEVPDQHRSWLDLPASREDTSTPPHHSSSGATSASTGGPVMSSIGEMWRRRSKSKEPENTEPVRPEQVARLARLIRHEDNAILFDAEGSGEYERASALALAARRHSTEAEFQAALKVAAQHEKDEQAEYERTGDPSVLALDLDSIRIPFTPSSAQTTATPTSSEGPSMTDINEIRASLTATSTRATATQGALAQASQEVREIAGRLQQVAQSSSQATIQEAMGLYTQVGDMAEQMLGMVSAARAAVDAYSASL